MAKADVAPRFVQSKTKEGLIKEVVSYQAKYGVSVKMISIVQELDTSWVAWFTDEDREPKNLTNVILRKTSA